MADELIAAAKTPPRSFFTRPALDLAPDLLGCLLVRDTPGGLVGGMLVETEAYQSDDDPSCHAFRGKTPRNWPLFTAGGHAYVYLIYGVYKCMNVSAGPEGSGMGVLLRGLEPWVGISTMQEARGVEKVNELTAGPGRLSMALGLDFELQGNDIRDPESPLRILRLPPRLRPQFEVCRGTRIGVDVKPSNEYPWRWYVRHNPYVSRPRDFSDDACNPG